MSNRLPQPPSSASLLQGNGVDRSLISFVAGAFLGAVLATGLTRYRYASSSSSRDNAAQRGTARLNNNSNKKNQETEEEALAPASQHHHHDDSPPPPPSATTHTISRNTATTGKRRTSAVSIVENAPMDSPPQQQPPPSVGGVPSSSLSAVATSLQHAAEVADPDEPLATPPPPSATDGETVHTSSRSSTPPAGSVARHGSSAFSGWSHGMVDGPPQDPLASGSPPPSNLQSRRSSVMSAVTRRRTFYHSADGGILLTNPFHGSQSYMHDLDSRASRLPRIPVYRVAVTGGPCSGKSSCMNSLRDTFTALGFRVYMVPEVATLLINGGLDFTCMTNEKRLTQQRVILQTIMMLEDAFFELASFDQQPGLLLCDRGTMDGSAYCTPEQWKELLDSTGYTNEELRDVRYNAVIHLVTTAIGAESYYTTANNSARRESVGEASKLDRETRNAWKGHRMIYVVDNSTDFSGKVERVVTFLKRLTRVEEEAAEGHLQPRNDDGITGDLGDSLETMRFGNDPPPFLISEASMKVLTSQAAASSSENGRAAEGGRLLLAGGRGNGVVSPAALPRTSLTDLSGLKRKIAVRSIDWSKIPSDAVHVILTVTTLHPSAECCMEKIIAREILLQEDFERIVSSCSAMTTTTSGGRPRTSRQGSLLEDSGVTQPPPPVSSNSNPLEQSNADSMIEELSPPKDAAMMLVAAAVNSLEDPEDDGVYKQQNNNNTNNNSSSTTTLTGTIIDVRSIESEDDSDGTSTTASSSSSIGVGARGGGGGTRPPLQLRRRTSRSSIRTYFHVGQHHEPLYRVSTTVSPTTTTGASGGSIFGVKPGAMSATTKLSSSPPPPSSSTSSSPPPPKPLAVNAATSARHIVSRHLTEDEAMLLCELFQDTSVPVTQKLSINFFHHHVHYSLLIQQEPKDVAGQMRLVVPYDARRPSEWPEWIELE